ncbi:hypothetical protein ACSYAD_36495, partial [Acaryochloris marina NIES-2412]
LLLHIHKDQLYWYCDHCRERFPFELTTRYHQSTQKHLKSGRYQPSPKKLHYFRSNALRSRLTNVEK